MIFILLLKMQSFWLLLFVINFVKFIGKVKGCHNNINNESNKKY